jgi:protein-S-isoprenylcysteine O-methyltransferase Ste14
MDLLGYVTIGLCLVWAVPSISDMGRRRSRAPSSQKDRNSLFVVMAANYVAIAAAVVIKLVPAATGGIGRILALSPYLGYAGCLVMLVGMVIRWRAIATLKQQFTIDVNIVEGHRLIEEGLYRFIRHPAYLGGQITMLGFGLALENWLSIVVLVVLPLAGHLYRISVEEKALLDHFGPAYKEYKRRTSRLIPGVF